MTRRTLAGSIGAGLSTSKSAWNAATEAARIARGNRGATTTDLAFVFLSAEHVDQAESAAAAVRKELAPRHLLGCVAQGVLAGGRELEDGPAVAVWAGELPGAEIECFHIDAGSDGDDTEAWRPPDVANAGLMALLVDPFTFPVVSFLSRLNAERQQIPIVGGLAAGGPQPGAQALIVDGSVHREGAVGAVMSGPSIVTIVSQGCRPIGREFVITACDGNVIYELAGKPALERLRGVIGGLAADEQALAAGGLLAGLVIDENRPVYDINDFLIRGLLGADETTGALAVGEAVRVGQTLRFFVRDAASADADLRRALTDARGDHLPAGALLFTCNGRGTNMFSEPDHDALAVADALGTHAVAGFFCGGEIGPVGGKTFLHGYTATLAVFLAR